MEQDVGLNSFTDLIHDDTAERIKSLPPKSILHEISSACAQRAADYVGL